MFRRRSIAAYGHGDGLYCVPASSKEQWEGVTSRPEACVILHNRSLSFSLSHTHVTFLIVLKSPSLAGQGALQEVSPCNPAEGEQAPSGCASAYFDVSVRLCICLCVSLRLSVSVSLSVSRGHAVVVAAFAFLWQVGLGRQWIASSAPGVAGRTAAPPVTVASRGRCRAASKF